MFKKFIVRLCLIFFANTLPAMADSAPITEREIAEVENFFNSYVDSANNYKEDLVNKYEEDADIERVVIKPDGTKESVKIPMERYAKELKSHKFAAKLAHYKNRYTNKRYEKLDENKFKIKTVRTPSRDEEGLNAEFIVTRTPDGFKISSESMETNVQRFLNEK